MQIIPVIDLMQGQVVHARHGQRHHYQPIQSQLCTGSEPLAVIQALVELYPFSTMYIADIDAIQGQETHTTLVANLAQRYPNIEFWLDDGNQFNAALHNLPNIRTVIGSENILDLPSYQAIRKRLMQPILSLDYKQNMTLGPAALYEDAQLWPQNVICMNLNQVGSNAGADIVTLNHLQKLNTQRISPTRIYAAGGIRNIDDCLQIKAMGIAGVLVASALHSRRIQSNDIARLDVA